MIVDRLFGARRQLSTYQNPEPWFIHQVAGSESASGERINETSALTLSAVWAATRFLTSKLAGLPCILYQEQDDGDRERAVDDPLYTLLKDSPCPGYDAFLWWETQFNFLINWGNAYAEIDRTPFGDPAALWPIHPYRLRIDNTQRPPSFFIRNDDGSEYPVSREDLLIFVGPLSEDGIAGKGVIRQARESIGLGMATEKYGARFFGNDARPGGLLIHPKTLSQEAKENIRTGWKRMFSGDKARSVAVLAEDMKYQQLGIPPEDGQFLETRQFNVTDVARWYGLPPHCIGDLTRATFSNIEEQNINVVVDSLMPWCIRVEKAVKAQLLPRGTTDRYWEFLADALLRGNAKAAAEGMQIQITNGVRTINECRRALNLPRIEGDAGDAHWIPVNVQPVERALNPPEPAPVNQPGKPTMPKDDSEDDDSPDDESEGNSKALSTLWQREWQRLGLVEAKELRRLAKTPDVFLPKWEAFLDSHQEAIERAFEPLASAFPKHFEDHAADGIASAECLWLANEALSLAECRPADLAARVESFVNHKLQARRQEPLECRN